MTEPRDQTPCSACGAPKDVPCICGQRIFACSPDYIDSDLEWTYADILDDE